MSFNNINVNVSGGQSIIKALQNYNTIILKPNIVDNRNVLTQEMMSERHTKYIIRWNYILEGATINVPQDCIIEFAGGTIDNGTIVGNNTLLMYSKPIDEVCPAERQGTFIYNTTVADEEDITSESGQLKFKDRPATDGMGRKILRKNIVNGVNTLTQSMIQTTNTIYVIQYDFTLGEDITVPENCVLEFDGGSVSASGSNNTITGQNTIIQAEAVRIFSNNISLSGLWSISEIYTEWFGAKSSDGIDIVTNDYYTIMSARTIDSTTAFEKALSLFGDEVRGKNNKCVIKLLPGVYKVSVDFQGYYYNIEGSSNKGTFLIPADITKPVININKAYSSWTKNSISNLSFICDALSPKGIGLAFGYGDTTVGDEGRCQINLVDFWGFDKAIVKWTGNLGIQLTNSYIYRNNYGLYAQDSFRAGATTREYAGCDFIDKCSFSINNVAIAYYNGKNAGLYGMIKVTNTDIETNGLGVYFESYGLSASFDNCWFDNTTNNVTLENYDGEEIQAKGDFVLIRSNINASNCRLQSMNLTESNIILNDCIVYNTSGTDIITDDFSIVESYNTYYSGLKNIPSIKTIKRKVPTNTGVESTGFNHPFVSDFVNALNKYYTEENIVKVLANDSNYFNGEVDNQASGKVGDVIDGISTEKCQLAGFTSYIKIFGGDVSKNWLFVSLEVKDTNNKGLRLDVAGGSGASSLSAWLGSTLDNKWHKYCVIFKNGNTTRNYNIKITKLDTTDTEVTYVEIGRLQMLQFDTYKEVIEFQESRSYIDNNKEVAFFNQSTVCNHKCTCREILFGSVTNPITELSSLCATKPPLIKFRGSVCAANNNSIDYGKASELIVKFNNITDIVNVGLTSGINLTFSIVEENGRYYLHAKATISTVIVGEFDIIYCTESVKKAGSTADRPTLYLVDTGFQYFDTSLSPARPIYWNGTAWVDATGTTV